MLAWAVGRYRLTSCDSSSDYRWQGRLSHHAFQTRVSLFHVSRGSPRAPGAQTRGLPEAPRRAYGAPAPGHLPSTRRRASRSPSTSRSHRTTASFCNTIRTLRSVAIHLRTRDTS